MHSNEELSLPKSEVLTVVLMNNEGKWNVTTCWLVNSHCHVRGVQCLHLQGQAVFDEVLFNPEDGGTTLLQKALNYLPVDVFQHTKTLVIFQCQSPSQASAAYAGTPQYTVQFSVSYEFSYRYVALHTNFSTSHNYCKSQTCLCLCFLYHSN